ncbi:programmed cell death protein 4-like isoform X1 [Pocillopora verrucosa]|uniref:programmed cell death protein 4-like isoform X1 n=2 Tax=Pocillopora verrucosa TaxID=203993 RepID=UPI0027970329|nr:programmed cell death protein 4-like isoform X1 [Pocillopora verrucosa]
MASSPSSGGVTTIPTASTKKMRVRSKSTSAVEDAKEAPQNNGRRVVIDGVKAGLKNGFNGTQNGEESSLFVKAPKDKHHDRKSRSGRRGLPKKGGAGGKGTWGAIGEVLTDEDMKIRDQHDPNYESEEDEDEPFDMKECKPELTEEEFSKNITPIVQEYFEHGDTEDVLLSLEELNISSRKYKVPAFAVSLALEKKATQREMASVLISDLYGKHLSQDDIAQGFQQLLDDLDDLSLDTPDAPEMVGKFIARAIADDCLPPAFVSNLGDAPPNSNQAKALAEAGVLLKMKHGMVRLDSVWGVAGGRRPVKYLVKKMVLLLKEYLSSEDIEEASRCVQELEVPHFYHELVYEAIIMTLEDEHDRVMTLMKNLLQFFSNTNIVKPDQIKNGFQRVFDSFSDIQLDIPHAHTLLEKFTDMCARDGIIPISFTMKVPSRGRKRFVSEGDGGLVKS